MAENSGIEWTDHTFNPWDGCKHCYAEREMDHRLHFVEWGPNGQRRRTSDSNWQQPRKWNERCRKLGVRERVFCASLADVFEGNSELDHHRDDLWKLIDETPNLDWLLLTKRPQNVEIMIPQRWWKWPQHVWVGTSIENQQAADDRIWLLNDSPATQTFISMEPLLGPVDLYMGSWEERAADWVIVGGESGPNARPMHPDWVRSIRDQCQAARVPFFFKQWGEFCPRPTPVRFEDSSVPPIPYRPGCPDPYPLGWVERLGKKLAGRLLDGQEWNELPEGLQRAEVGGG